MRLLNKASGLMTLPYEYCEMYIVVGVSNSLIDLLGKVFRNIHDSEAASRILKHFLSIWLNKIIA